MKLEVNSRFNSLDERSCIYITQNILDNCKMNFFSIAKLLREFFDRYFFFFQYVSSARDRVTNTICRLASQSKTVSRKYKVNLH